MKNRTKIILATASIMLSSCMTTLDYQDLGRKPTNAEAEIFVKQHIESSYYDSDVKNLRIKEPVLGKIFVGDFFPTPQSGYVICYQLNAKNLYGAYTGTRKYSLGVQDMQVKPQGNINMEWRECGGAKFINLND